MASWEVALRDVLRSFHVASWNLHGGIKTNIDSTN
jgi:hypothetical protein